MPIDSRSRPSTASFVAVCERSCADSFIVRVRVTAFAITDDGQMPSSLILGCSRCPRPIDWRANPDAETTDWRARRGKTAHRVRREGTASAVSYPYPWPTSVRSSAWEHSDLCLFGYFESIVDFDTEIPDRTFELGVAKQQLYRAQVLGTSVNQRRFRPPHGVRSVCRII